MNPACCVPRIVRVGVPGTACCVLRPRPCVLHCFVLHGKHAGVPLLLLVRRKTRVVAYNSDGRSTFVILTDVSHAPKAMLTFVDWTVGSEEGSGQGC